MKQASLAKADQITRFPTLPTVWRDVNVTDKKPGFAKVFYDYPQSQSTRFVAAWQYAIMNVGPW